MALRLGFCRQAFLLQPLPLSFCRLTGLLCLGAALCFYLGLLGLLLTETFDLGLLTSPLFFLLLYFGLSLKSGFTGQPFNGGQPCYLCFPRPALCLSFCRLASAVFPPCTRFFSCLFHIVRKYPEDHPGDRVE